MFTLELREAKVHVAQLCAQLVGEPVTISVCLVTGMTIGISVVLIVAATLELAGTI